MSSVILTTMFIAAQLKIDIITKGTSIPNFLKAHPETDKLPKADLDYIKVQGKKLLLAMAERGKDVLKKK